MSKSELTRHRNFGETNYFKITANAVEKIDKNWQLISNLILS